jgi:hypothetical protein
LVVRNDVVKGVFGRLGMVGVILIASALIFGAVAGGVVVHRLQFPPAASHTVQRGDNADETGDGQSQHKPSPHPSPSPEADDNQDKGA